MVPGPGLHTSPMEHTRALITLKVDRIVEIIRQADVASNVGHPTTGKERSEGHQLGSTFIRPSNHN
jgi:hypothetical protein